MAGKTYLPPWRRRGKILIPEVDGKTGSAHIKYSSIGALGNIVRTRLTGSLVSEKNYSIGISGTVSA